MKEIVDTLFAISVPIIDDQLLMHIFGGLSHEFDVVIVNLWLRKYFVSLGEA